jgi:diacylglycerol kinase family enzyme
MRLHLVENPSAGRPRTAAFREAVAGHIRAGGHEVTTFSGERPGDLARHVRGLAADAFDRLIVCGGDGTLGTLLNARGGRLPWPVGIAPVGTANLAARETHVPLGMDPVAVAAALLRAEPWAVDLVRIERPDADPAWALTSVGVGLDGAIVRAVAALRGAATTSGGYLRWVRPIVDVVFGFGFPDIEVVVDGGVVHHASVVVIQNAHSYGGLFVVTPEARLDSGRLDVLLARARGVRDLVRLGLRGATGRMAEDRQARLVHGRRVEIRAATALPVQCDGDPAGTTPLDVVLEPRALTLLRAPRAAGAASR